VGDFSNRLEILLKYLDISSYRLAKVIGTSEAVLSNIKKRKNNPSYDLLLSILNNYKVLNAEWLITGKGEMLKNSEKIEYTLEHNPRIEGVSEPDMDHTPSNKTAILHPKTAKKLHPTLHPTSENCQICEEKDAVIAEQKARILDLKEYIEMLRQQIPDQKKAVG